MNLLKLSKKCPCGNTLYVGMTEEDGAGETYATDETYEPSLNLSTAYLVRPHTGKPVSAVRCFQCRRKHFLSTFQAQGET